jgi:hypothetical protein
LKSLCSRTLFTLLAVAAVAKGQKGTGAKKMLGGAALSPDAANLAAQSLQSFTVAAPFEV